MFNSDALKQKMYSISCTVFCAFFVITSVHAIPNTDQKKTDKQLSSVQQEIEIQKSNIIQFNQKRNILEEELKADDISIGITAKAMNITLEKLTNTKDKIAELVKTKAELTALKQHQEKLLAQQLRAAYSTGNHDYLKLILNQQKSSSVQRTVTYFEYLNAARIKEIDQFQVTLAALLKVSTEYQVQLDNLQLLTNEQTQQQQVLLQNKTKRANTLSSLSKDLLSSQQQLSKLETEEANLVSALKKLEVLMQAQMNQHGLSQLKRKLSWPVKGKFINNYGSQKQGYLKWKGVQISAKSGQQVQTIHNGTVLFADWLKGYGLVTVIDHGNGYMSLYGHNQTLLKNVGDQVETGEPIALIGQSGGQNQPSLYFEIRHRGEAVNPNLWCKR